MSKLDDEKKQKRKDAEEAEVLDATGQESEHKAVKWVQEEAKMRQIKEDKLKADQLTRLDETRKSRAGYRTVLLNTLHDMVRTIALPQNYDWGVWFDGKGIRLAIRDKFGETHMRAFKPSYSPEHDLQLLMKYTVWAEDIYDLVEKRTIWTPNKLN